MRKLFLLSILGVVSLQYIQVLQFRLSVFLWIYDWRPFISRLLVPAIAQYLPFDEITNISIVAFVFCVGLAYVMIQIRDKCLEAGLSGDVFLVVSFTAFMVLSSVYAILYDTATAFFFTLIVYLWSRGKTGWTLLLFFLLTVNRETSFLLIPVYVLCFWKKTGTKTLIGRTFSMTAIYIATRFFISVAVSGAPGRNAWVQPIDNIEAYSNVTGVLLLLTLVFMFVLSIRNSSDETTKMFLLLAFPVLLVAHIIFGMPYEVRMFAEVFPLMLINLHGVKNENK